MKSHPKTMTVDGYDPSARPVALDTGAAARVGVAVAATGGATRTPALAAVDARVDPPPATATTTATAPAHTSMPVTARKLTTRLRPAVLMAAPLAAWHGGQVPR
jgi:hypothetical protein